MSLRKPQAPTEQTNIRDLTTKKTVKVTFQLPKELHKQAKQKALDLDTTVTELIKAGLKDVLARK